MSSNKETYDAENAKFFADLDQSGVDALIANDAPITITAKQAQLLFSAGIAVTTSLFAASAALRHLHAGNLASSRDFTDRLYDNAVKASANYREFLLSIAASGPDKEQ